MGLKPEKVLARRDRVGRHDLIDADFVSFSESSSSKVSGSGCSDLVASSSGSSVFASHSSTVVSVDGCKAKDVDCIGKAADCSSETGTTEDMVPVQVTIKIPFRSPNNVICDVCLPDTVTVGEILDVIAVSTSWSCRLHTLFLFSWIKFRVMPLIVFYFNYCFRIVERVRQE